MATLSVTQPSRAEEAPRPDAVKKWSRTDHVRVGALAAVGFPSPLGAEALVAIERYVAVGAAYGFSPDVGISGVTVSLWSAAGDVRAFPFRNPFFLGLRLGYQHLGATDAAYAQSMNVDTWFANPRVGALWTFKSGFSIGFDAGVELPMTSSVSGSSQAMAIPALTSAAATLGKTVLPTIDLLQMGFLL